LPEAVKGKTRNKVAAFIGTAARTLAKAEEVVKAAEAERDKFGKLVEGMDRTGRGALGVRG
jgi:hypothetical protein